MNTENAEWIAGAVVVAGMVAGFAGLLAYAIWDVVRLRKGENLSITASTWIGKFAVRHPIIVFTSGISLGILLGHLLWPQTIRILGAL